ncbi:MAG: response regulator [Candidatus Angelobacter sp.]
MRAFLVDDEPLALSRLARLLEGTRRIEIVGSATDPVAAVSLIQRERPDVLFLDIQMPEMTGFDLLAKIDPQPLVIFVTAYDEFALRAFEVNSIDYLLKPIEEPQLERALRKLERITAGNEMRPDIHHLLAQIAATIRGKEAMPWPERLPSRVGERIEFVEVAQVTHFVADEKLTYAVTSGKRHVIDSTIQALEQNLDPRQFVRIHRSTIVALKCIRDLHSMFGGRICLRLKDDRGTELDVARNRVSILKERLGMR